MTQIVIMLYEDNDKVITSLPLICILSASALHSNVQISTRLYIVVVCRIPPQRSVSMLSFTSVPESKGVKMRRTYHLALASDQRPQRSVNLWMFVGFVHFCFFQSVCETFTNPDTIIIFKKQIIPYSWMTSIFPPGHISVMHSDVLYQLDAVSAPATTLFTTEDVSNF